MFLSIFFLFFCSFTDIDVFFLSIIFLISTMPEMTRSMRRFGPVLSLCPSSHFAWGKFILLNFILKYRLVYLS